MNGLDRMAAAPDRPRNAVRCGRRGGRLGGLAGLTAEICPTGVRGYVITMVLPLAGPPLLARPLLSAAAAPAARSLRAGTCAALLALMPAEAAVYQFAETPPRGGTD